MYVTKKCYQSDDFKHGVIMGSIYVQKEKWRFLHVKHMPIFTANHISLSTLNVCTNNVNEINASDKVSKAEKSIYASILAMKLDKKVLSNCQCKVHHVNAKCTMSMQSAPH
jgi:hypothetical protein